MGSSYAWSSCCARSSSTRRSTPPEPPRLACRSIGSYLLLGLIGVTIVVSIQTVGIILVVAMLVTPAATAELLVDRFWDLVRVAIAVAVVAAVVGLYVSYYLSIASGASIVLVETICFAHAGSSAGAAGLQTNTRRRLGVSLMPVAL